MYLTQSNVIRGLSKQEYTMLREMCQYSNNLYNVAVYTIRQHYFDTRQFLRYEENSPICKENENYGLLQAGVAQQILKMADRSFRSFFGLLQKVKADDYRSKDVRLPHYREKGGWFPLVLSTNAINIKNGFLTVPMSRKYAKIHNGHRIRLPVPDRLKEKTIQEQTQSQTSKHCRQAGPEDDEPALSVSAETPFPDAGHPSQDSPLYPRFLH